MTNIKFEDIDAKAYEVAIRKLAMQDRTSLEIEKSLKDKGYDKETMDDVIIYLKENGYINHNNYGKRFIRYGLSKKWGPFRIEYKLKEKGLSQDEIDIAHEEYEDEENIQLENCYLENAREIAIKIINEQIVDDEYKIPDKVIAKLGRKLSSLGYDSEMIYKVINEAKLSTHCQY